MSLELTVAKLATVLAHQTPKECSERTEAVCVFSALYAAQKGYKILAQGLPWGIVFSRRALNGTSRSQELRADIGRLLGELQQLLIST
jgi:hypothetical protein